MKQTKQKTHFFNRRLVIYKLAENDEYNAARTSFVNKIAFMTVAVAHPTKVSSSAHFLLATLIRVSNIQQLLVVN